MNFTAIGLTPREVYDTMTAIAPGILLQERCSAEEAAIRARDLVVRCVEQVELLFAHPAESARPAQPAPPTRQRDDLIMPGRPGQSREGHIAKDRTAADRAARDFAMGQVASRTHTAPSRGVRGALDPE